jgi:hypothetical protein
LLAQVCPLVLPSPMKAACNTQGLGLLGRKKTCHCWPHWPMREDWRSRLNVAERSRCRTLVRRAASGQNFGPLRFPCLWSSHSSLRCTAALSSWVSANSSSCSSSSPAAARPASKPSRARSRTSRWRLGVGIWARLKGGSGGGAGSSAARRGAVAAPAPSARRAAPARPCCTAGAARFQCSTPPCRAPGVPRAAGGGRGPAPCQAPLPSARLARRPPLPSLINDRGSGDATAVTTPRLQREEELLVCQ